jgi:hypothetical protein
MICLNIIDYALKFFFKIRFKKYKKLFSSLRNALLIAILKEKLIKII